MSEVNSKHPSVDELKKFALGLSSESDSTWIESHLDACEQCCQVMPSLESHQDRLVSQLSAALSSKSEPADIESNADGLALLRIIHDSKRAPDSGNTNASDNSVAFSKIPKAISRFEILDQLGEGSFGVVWRAFDTRLRRDVAIKIPRLASFAD